MSRVLSEPYKLLKQFIKSVSAKSDSEVYICSSSGSIDGVTLFQLFQRRGVLQPLLKICSTLVWISSTAAFANPAFLPVAVSIEQGPDMTHLEFKNRESWDYKISKEGTQSLSFEVDKLDDASLVQLKTLKSPYIQSIEITDGTDLRHKITITLQKNAESFDYITDQPSRLVIDFFKPTSTAPVVQNKLAPKKGSALASTLPAKKKLTNRQPASDFLLHESGAEKKNSVLLDGADPEYKRFKMEEYEIKDSALIASTLNLYIEFPMMVVPNQELKTVLEQPNTYSFAEEDSDENKKVRLLSILFRKGKSTTENPEKAAIEKPRTAVFLKTLELFRKEYPHSKYAETLRFMEADTYYNIWLNSKDSSDFDQAIQMYTKILLEVPNSPLHERTMRLIAYSYFEKKDFLSALKWLQSYQTKYPESPQDLRIQMSIAETLSHLSNLDQAIQIYDSLEQNKNAGPLAVEAIFRKGDALALQSKYAQAIETYELALQKYEKDQIHYPNAYYNISESRFWMSKEKANLKKSLENYIEFLMKFPKDGHASFAMERVGELLEILGAEEAKFNGAFLEAIYRYPNSQASEIAKIRMLRARIKNMKDEDIQDELTKVNEFVKKSQLPKLKEFRSIMISDGYYDKKDYDKTLNELITFYQNNPLSNYLDIFKKRIVKTFRDQMIHTIELGDYLKTFQIYGKNAGIWLKDANRFDIDYLLGEAFEKTGVPDEAIVKYKKVLSSLTAIKGTQEEKERKVFEVLPTTDELNLRLAASYVFKGDSSTALEHLKRIEEAGLKNEEDKVEKVFLSSIVNEKLGNTRQALKDLKDLTESWKGQPEKLSKIYLRLSQLQSSSGQVPEALKSVNTLIEMAESSASTEKPIVSEADLIAAYQHKAMLAQKSSQAEVAKDSYRTLLEKFEEKYPLYSSRYNLGKIYFDQGNLKEAEKIWSPLADRADAQLWSRLAQENLKNRNWNDDYKKYTNRIPAMAKDKPASKNKDKAPEKTNDQTGNDANPEEKR